MREIRIGERSYEIYYGQNAICALEDELDASIIDILRRVQEGAPRISDLRAIVWAGMLAKQRSLTPEAVGTLLDQADIRLGEVARECLAELASAFERHIRFGEETEDSPKNE